jgi:flagellar hook protein FlgE
LIKAHCHKTFSFSSTIANALLVAFKKSAANFSSLSILAVIEVY